MPKLDFDRIQKAAVAMSDEELTDAITAQREDYVPEALEIMASELERRGVNPRERIPSAITHKPASLAWLSAYVAFTGVGALGVVITWLAGRLEGGLVSLAMALGSLFIAFHLNRRAQWAWWANALLLGVLTLGCASNILLGVWGVANGLYFYRQRSHFVR